MSKPAFTIVAKDKNTGEYLDVGALFEGRMPGTYDLLLREGASILVTRKWDKDARAQVDIKPVTVTSGKEGSCYINVRPLANEIEQKVRETFSFGANEKMEKFE